MKPGRESQTAGLVAAARAAAHGRTVGVDFQDPTALALLPEEARRRVEDFRAGVAPKDQRARMPALLLKVIAQWRNRIEASFGEITEQMGLTRHGAHTFWGLLTRTAATIAAHTLQLTCPCQHLTEPT